MTPFVAMYCFSSTMITFISQYWIQVIFGLIITALTAGFKYLHKQNKIRSTEQCAVKLGIQALLRDRIIEQYNKYMDKDYIPIYAMDNVEAMYKEYHALGGNGTITELYKELLKLSHRESEE
jgi:hypothetical protein